MPTIDEVINNLKLWDEERSTELLQTQQDNEELTAVNADLLEKSQVLYDENVRLTSENAQLKARIKELEGEEEPMKPMLIMGMSSPNKDWETRLQQVGPNGINGRRVFAQLNSNADDQMDLVEYCVVHDMLPVFSWRVPSIANALRGQYDGWVQKLADRLKAYDIDVSTTFHHEPNPDMSGKDFVTLNERWSPIMTEAELDFGPFLNGWLLDRQLALFKSFTSPLLLKGGLWTFTGIDTYEEGTILNPGTIKPADRIPKLKKFIVDEGVPDMPLRIGEWNGYSEKTIEDCGNAILNEGNIDVACMWNATTGKGYILEGGRLAAFKRVKADVRVLQ